MNLQDKKKENLKKKKNKKPEKSPKKFSFIIKIPDENPNKVKQRKKYHKESKGQLP